MLFSFVPQLCMSEADAAFQKSYSINFPRGKSEQKHLFSLETRNEVSFPSTYDNLNFTNLPLNPTMRISPLLVAHI